MKDDKNRVLGDSCAVCPSCGFGKRYMLGYTAAQEQCPDCGSDLITSCTACGSPVVSIMQVDCRACGEPLRAGELWGVPIRRKAEPKLQAAAPDTCAGQAAANNSAD